MKNCRGRLDRIEKEIGKDSMEIKLEDGGEFYASQKDLLIAYVEAVEWMVGKIDKEDISAKTMKFIKAKEGQDKPCGLIRETLKNAENGEGMKESIGADS